MKISVKNISNAATGVLRFVVLVLALCAPATVLGQGVLSTPQTGTVQDFNDGERFFIIGGQRYDVDFEVTEFLLRGEPFDIAYLEVGMVVRYTVRDGILARVEILGPNNLVEDLLQEEPPH